MISSQLRKPNTLPRFDHLIDKSARPFSAPVGGGEDIANPLIQNSRFFQHKNRLMSRIRVGIVQHRFQGRESNLPHCSQRLGGVGTNPPFGVAKRDTQIGNRGCVAKGRESLGRPSAHGPFWIFERLDKHGPGEEISDRTQRPSRSRADVRIGILQAFPKPGAGLHRPNRRENVQRGHSSARLQFLKRGHDGLIDPGAHGNENVGYSNCGKPVGLVEGQDEGRHYCGIRDPPESPCGSKTNLRIFVLQGTRQRILGPTHSDQPQVFCRPSTVPPAPSLDVLEVESDQAQLFEGQGEFAKVGPFAANDAAQQNILHHGPVA